MSFEGSATPAPTVGWSRVERQASAGQTLVQNAHQQRSKPSKMGQTELGSSYFLSLFGLSWVKGFGSATSQTMVKRSPGDEAAVLTVQAVWETGLKVPEALRIVRHHALRRSGGIAIQRGEEGCVALSCGAREKSVL